MKRRDFFAFAGAVAAWPVMARAQQSDLPVIGFLHVASAASTKHNVAGFLKGLGEAGFVVDRNVTIKFYWGDSHFERLPALAMSMVQQRVNMILAGGGPAAGLAAKAETATVPIVFVTGDDPVTHGLVASLNRPERNLTGVNFLVTALVTKRLELLRELFPKARSFGFLIDPDNPEAEGEMRNLQAAAEIVGQKIVVLKVDRQADIGAVFRAASDPIDAVLVGSGPTAQSRIHQIVGLAIRHSLPTMFSTRVYAAAGGLMSYGTSITDAYRQAGVYASKILQGTKPSDLPVIQPTKFELVINLKTAKALGLKIPESFLLRADEVIE